MRSDTTSDVHTLDGHHLKCKITGFSTVKAYKPIEQILRKGFPLARSLKDQRADVMLGTKLALPMLGDFEISGSEHEIVEIAKSLETGDDALPTDMGKARPEKPHQVEVFDFSWSEAGMTAFRGTND